LFQRDWIEDKKKGIKFRILGVKEKNQFFMKKRRKKWIKIEIKQNIDSVDMKKAQKMIL
jgi:hypothetical protein